MKSDLSYLPSDKQDDLLLIVKYILEEITETEIIILFGSYARGDYVDYDQQVEFDMRTFFMSDYDILVLTNRPHNYQNATLRKLKKVSEKFSQKYKIHTTPLQFIVENVNDFNKAIKQGRYFYTDIKKEGILLYTSGNFSIEESKELDFNEIKQLAEEYFREKFGMAQSFFKLAKYAYDYGDYRMSAFQLHQTAENYLFAIVLTYTLYSPKEHKLDRLFSYVKIYFNMQAIIFPDDDEESSRLYELLEESYVQARYNAHFIVSRQDIEALLPKIENLRDLTKKICEERVSQYDKFI